MSESSSHFSRFVSWLRGKESKTVNIGPRVAARPITKFEFGDLPLPAEMAALLHAGIWPGTDDEAQRQNLKPIVPDETIRKVAASALHLYLDCPPLYSVASLIEQGQDFWKMPEYAIEQIDPNLTLVIGDFGMGSEEILALDYRGREHDPSVIRLKWFDNTNGVSEVEFKEKIKQNNWVQVAPDFATFCRDIGLGRGI
jgi:hypothetical protein